jgi:branched-chain amino acid transport system ATP-binding protein
MSADAGAVATREAGPASNRPASVLAAESISVNFEGVKAVDDVSLEVVPGRILGLIGPNGAGKTTLVNVLSGFQPSQSGRVLVDGDDISELAPERRARLGVVRTFQGSRSFGDLTVSENVEVSAVGMGASRREAGERAREALAELGISELGEHRAADLTTGQERRLQVARVIAMRPRFLFLDEPAAGLNESESDELVSVISALPERLGCGVLLIDHDMRVIMSACQEIVVLDYGAVISQGTPTEVRSDQRVIDAYLGS